MKYIFIILLPIFLFSNEKEDWNKICTLENMLQMKKDFFQLEKIKEEFKKENLEDKRMKANIVQIYTGLVF
jgi:hypothetical protein